MKIKIGLFFGGKSTEHEVSIITALQAYNAFNKDKYEVVPIYITKENQFFTSEHIGRIEEYSNIPALLKKSKQVILIADNLYEFTGKKISKKPLFEINIAFLAVHGTNVEDGALQGFMQTMGIPYTGCDVTSSAIGMDKSATKAVLKQAGIPVLDCFTITAKEFSAGYSLPDTMSYPVIVKPLNLGSSIGIKKADNPEELTGALEHAFLFANRVIIEPAIVNLKEVNCSVLGDIDHAEASECEEPIASGTILDFDDKYSGGGKNNKNTGMASLKRKIPAGISAQQREEIRDLSVKAFQALGCSGVARIDFLLDTESGKTYFNEINTIPGSLAFYLWEPVGVTYPELLDRMVQLSLKRERDLKNLNFTFENNILSNFKGGMKGSK
ncbi:MAG: D-alanine--D-alanine ligase [Oscillospiraceae bacterium]|nr:D-alanine--D-alanine ligase [Oscillospiraceae bacterium]